MQYGDGILTEGNLRPWGELCYEVEILFTRGALHEFAAEWISRLPFESQPHAAKICMIPLTGYEERNPIRSGIRTRARSTSEA